jgi:DNA-binding XRE family transcriptional regulator
MNKAKKKRLESKGWKIGSAKDFLELSDEEMAYIELKLALSLNLKKRRQAKKLTQNQLAKIIKSSQSRVAKMETGDPTVTIDLLIRSLFALGATRKDIARFISTTKLAPTT